MHIICLSAPSQNPRKDSCVTIEYIVMNSADKSCFLSLKSHKFSAHCTNTQGKKIQTEILVQRCKNYSMSSFKKNNKKIQFLIRHANFKQQIFTWFWGISLQCPAVLSHFSNFNFLSSYEIGTGTWSDSDKKNSGQQG